VEFERRGRLHEHAPVPHPARIQEQGGQPEDQGIKGGQIRHPMSATIADQQLMFEQQRFCGGGADAPWAQQLRDGGKQVEGEDPQFANERTLAWLPADARLPGTGEFRHTANSHPTPFISSMYGIFCHREANA
jgi:hypothetical protein